MSLRSSFYSSCTFCALKLSSFVIIRSIEFHFRRRKRIVCKAENYAPMLPSNRYFQCDEARLILLRTEKSDRKDFNPPNQWILLENNTEETEFDLLLRVISKYPSEFHIGDRK